MKYNWLRDHQAQNQVEVQRQKGATNQADYFTKHHPSSHHELKRYDYILFNAKFENIAVFFLNAV